ncbi:ABC transporter ATP-binding protein [Jiangella mangrovi]|uniref:Iron(III) transport system ATP-binding protein n=1 Tax=Jiangella mangrovi TaxID=1524084 RepID=A0A7W9GNK9_9ACTN|nr:ABC transporter ATP-binding protein [Jiangella mangrovi]MBB5786876.1 iron(III) transport system ATP-binding protein [Jiangella mangrovi]
MGAIRVEHLFHAYDDGGREVRAVDDVSFDVEQNAFYTLLGPSGCGKTTTLRCIAGLEEPSSGEIELDGVAVVSARGIVPTNKRPIGMVFQDYAVWPHMTVAENVAFPLKVAGDLSGREIQAKVMDALALMGMEQYVQRRATQLSGGQQQRLSLARALVRDPKVLLLDEPLSNLDAKLREQMRAELRQLQRRIKVTTVFVTHDQVEALSMSNTIAVMNHGKIVQEGSPREIYLQPNSRFVASFVGATNFVTGVVDAYDDDTRSAYLSTPAGPLRCITQDPPEVGSAVTVAIRPEAVEIGYERDGGENLLHGEVEVGLFVGDAVDYRVRVGDQDFRVTGPQRSRFHRKDAVVLHVPADECVVIPDDPEVPAGVQASIQDQGAR